MRNILQTGEKYFADSLQIPDKEFKMTVITSLVSLEEDESCFPSFYTSKNVHLITLSKIKLHFITLLLGFSSIIRSFAIPFITTLIDDIKLSHTVSCGKNHVKLID